MKTSSGSEKGTMTSTKRISETMDVRNLFEKQLKNIYWAEKELTRFMPVIVRKVKSEELKEVLEDHIELTKKQVVRLEDIFKQLKTQAQALKCEGMDGLIREAEQITGETKEGMIRDAFIIGAVQKVEHYEVASYGTMKSIATGIGEFEVATLLGETLNEEKEADMNLTDVAENFVNIEALQESGDLEEEEEEDEDYEEEDFDAEEEEYDTADRKKSKSKQNM